MELGTMAKVRYGADRVAEILAAAHESGDTESFRTHVLRHFRDATDGDGAVFATSASASAIQCFDHDRSVCERFFAHPENYRCESARMAQASRTGRPYLDVQLFEDRSKLALYADLGIRALLGCPLVFRGQFQGHIIVVKERGDFDPAVLAQVEVLAPAASLAEAARRSMNGDDAAMRNAFAGLTRRERQIAQLLANGLRNKEIAQIVGTSPDTIRKQTVSVFGKLGLRGRTDVARWVERLGIAPEQPTHGSNGSSPRIRGGQRSP
jgi:DNA-binding CsgD family transcriptional regulator